MHSQPACRFLAVLLMAVSSVTAALGQAGMRAEFIAQEQRSAAPEFHLQDSSGKTTDLKSYRGKIVLLDFWATWCHGCKEEIPWFAEFNRKYADRGVQVVGVSLDDGGWKVVKPFIENARIPYRILLGNEAVSSKYRIAQMPDTFLIDRRGRIAAKYVGMVDRDNVEANIRAAIAEH